MLLSCRLRSLFVSPPCSAAHVRWITSRRREIVFYKWPTIRYLQVASRLKVPTSPRGAHVITLVSHLPPQIYQVAGMLALLGPATHWYRSGLITTQTLVSAWGAGLGTTAAFLVLSYYIRRFVGEMALCPTSRQLRVSLISFWGRRRELVFPLNQVVPFPDSQTARPSRFQVLEIVGSDWRMLYSLRHGHVLQAQLMQEALGLK